MDFFPSIQRFRGLRVARDASKLRALLERAAALRFGDFGAPDGLIQAGPSRIRNGLITGKT